jgi:hypothetical protein
MLGLLTIVCGLFAYHVWVNYLLIDDAFISFRYSDNLVRGHGLRWNPGEQPVEGYTNFLWVMLMALGLEFGITPELFSSVLGIICGIGVLALVFSYGRSQWGALHPLTWVPLIVMCCSRSFTAWCSGGLASMCFTLLGFGAVTAYLSESEAQKRWPLASAGLLAAATLCRPEGALFALVLGALFLVEILRARRCWVSLAVWAATYWIVAGAHLAWRISYYGDWVPNTFHVKVNGVWTEQAYKYFTLFSDCYRIVWFLPLLVFAIVFHRTHRNAVFMAVLVSYLGYLTLVGGDAFEFRLLVVIFPYFYLLLMDGIDGLYSVLCKGHRLAGVAIGGLVVIALAVATLLGSDRRPVDRDVYGVSSLRGLRHYWQQRSAESKELRRYIDEGVLPNEFVCAVRGAGVVPYYTRWETVDTLGLSDRYVARLPLEQRGRIAHERRAPHAYLTERKVAVFDFSSRLLFQDPFHLKVSHQYLGLPLRVRAIRLERKQFLVFATFVSDQELEQIFRGHVILKGI